MNSTLKEKKKALDATYLEFYYESKKYVREQNLNKIAFQEVSDQLLEQIYQCFVDKVPVKECLGKDSHKTIDKMVRNKPKKTKLQSCLDTLCICFISMSFLLPVLYLLNWTSKNEYAYNKGLEMYVNSSKMSQVFIMAVLLSLTMIIMNKVTMKNTYSKTSLYTTITLGSIFAVLAIFINLLPKETMIHFNFLLLEGIFLVFSIGIYVWIMFSYANTYKKYVENHSPKK